MTPGRVRVLLAIIEMGDVASLDAPVGEDGEPHLRRGLFGR
jgi:hypothetical protein